MELLKEFIHNVGMTESLTESIEAGYEAIFEGYADVRETKQFNAFSQAKQKAASLSPAMAVILRSEGQLNKLYSEMGDDEPELDMFRTSMVDIDGNGYEPDPTGDIIEDSLGLTAGDMSNRNARTTMAQTRNQSRQKAKQRSLDLTGF